MMIMETSTTGGRRALTVACFQTAPWQQTDMYTQAAF